MVSTNEIPTEEQAPVEEVAEVSIPEQAAALMADFERFKILKEELSTVRERMGAQQVALAERGMVMSFPEVDLGISALRVVNTPLVIPPRTDEETRNLPEPPDDELASQNPMPAAPQDLRREEQIQKESFVSPDATEVSAFTQSIANKFATVVEQGFSDSKTKGGW